MKQKKKKIHTYKYIFEKTMVENFPNLVKSINLQSKKYSKIQMDKETIDTSQ